MSAPFTVGDKGTKLKGRCLDGATPVDLTGCTVTLYLRPPDATAARTNPR